MEKFAVKRDPRLKKLRDFRKRGHCSCSMCKGYKSWWNEEKRTRKREDMKVSISGSVLDTD